jgi:DNA (cytosine-5)-methyltransferase 1
MGGDGQSVGALAAEPGMKQQCYVAFNLRGRDGGSLPEPAPDNQASMRAASGGSSRSYVTNGGAGVMAVRRLTPC